LDQSIGYVDSTTQLSLLLNEISCSKYNSEPTPEDFHGSFIFNPDTGYLQLQDKLRYYKQALMYFDNGPETEYPKYTRGYIEVDILSLLYLSHYLEIILK